MNIHEVSYTIQPHTYTYYDCTVGDLVGLDFSELCAVSTTEHMKPLTPRGIQNHAYGRAMVRSYLSGHGVPHVDPISYAGITGFEERVGSKLAVVGSMLTLPQKRHAGYGLQVVDALCEVASSAVAISQHGHRGLLARCNEHSEKIVKRLGFSTIGVEAGKLVLVKMIE